MFRIGIGFDVHPLKAGRRFVLGCVEIDHPTGLDGHSDADVLAHAITDAILGAMGKRDIGTHYPPDEPRWKDRPGQAFLTDMRELMAREGWRVVNLDTVVIAERPRLAAHIPTMVWRVAEALGLESGQVGIKATTSERLGFTGREEGVAAQAVVLLTRQVPPAPSDGTPPAHV